MMMTDGNGSTSNGSRSSSFSDIDLRSHYQWQDDDSGSDLVVRSAANVGVAGEYGDELDFSMHHMDGHEMGVLFRVCFNVLERAKLLMVLFWMAMLIWGLLDGAKWMGMAQDRLQAPKGTEAFLAQQRFEELFPDKASEIPFIVVIRCEDGCHTVATRRVEGFHDQIVEFAMNFSDAHDGCIVNLMSWFAYNGTKFDLVKSQFLSRDKQTTFINFVMTEKVSQHVRYKFVNEMGGFLNERRPGKMFSGMTGFDAIAKDGSEAAKELVTKIDMATLPLGFLLIGWHVGSWRLLLVALANVAVSILAGFAIMVVSLDKDDPPDSATVSLMEVMGLAMSIDYALFMLKRYRDEIILQHRPSTEATAVMLYRAGHVIVLSGSTMICVFLCFLVLPAPEVRMNGFASSVAILICVLVSLTLIPSMLLVFPSFFSHGIHEDLFHATWANWKQCLFPEKQATSTHQDRWREDSANGLLVDHDDSEGEELHNHNLLREQDDDEDENRERYLDTLSLWEYKYEDLSKRYKLTKAITTWPRNVQVLSLIYVLILPLAIAVLSLKTSQDIRLGLPKNSDATESFKVFLDAFPGGVLSPFYAVVTTSSVASVEGQHDRLLFRASRDVAKGIVRYVDEISVENVVTVSNLQGIPVCPFMAHTLLKLGTICPEDTLPKNRFLQLVCEVVGAYKVLWDQSVNHDESAILVTTLVPFFVFSKDSEKLIEQVKSKVFDRVLAKYGQEKIELHLCGVEVALTASVTNTFNSFPLLVVITFIGTFVVMGVLLWSVMVPLRLFATLVVPLASVFGLAVLVYQYRWFNWTGITAISTTFDSMYWYVPMLCFTLTVGIALDVDILLITRIMEHRANHHDIHASIVKAVCETTGTVITGAIVMCLAFGGMLLSTQPAVAQIGWLLTTGVLFDAFIVNLVLVPALLSLASEDKYGITWWPTKMPTQNLKTL